MSLKEIQSRLLQWDSSENPLAPLDSEQRDAIRDLEQHIQGAPLEDEPEPDVNSESDKEGIPSMCSTCDFLEWYQALSETNLKASDAPYEAYYKQLESKRDQCVAMSDQIVTTLTSLDKLSEEYNLVSDKTNALHVMSEQLLADQNKLSATSEEIKHRLHYFTQVEQLAQRLASPTLSVNSEQFFSLLQRIDQSVDYMREHSDYKESHTYLMKYRHLQSRAIGLIRSYVTSGLERAADTEPSDLDGADAYAVYFGKFQATAPRLKAVIKEVEDRAEKYAEYASLLSELQQEYATRRWRVAGDATKAALAAVKEDPCSRLRNACSLLAHACADEWALYQHFFDHTSTAIEEYLVSLCNSLYETLRPLVIHTNHLETLAELCLILRVEVLAETVHNDPTRLAALEASARALLQDAQERLTFRAHVRLRQDVLQYRPAPPDLAYPDKLLMMEQIALSLQEPSMKRNDSHNSMVSDVSATSQEVANINSEPQRPQGSPADLHGMWYPAVRRTLSALSRLYRCLEKRVFQGIAQEAISMCVQSVDDASKQISVISTPIDGELFQIKHLLILREQIAPFQVDFIVKETSLDFSNMKNAAYGLFQKPRQIFSLNSNNALLEFLLEGTPMVREHLLDSRKEVDRHLKGCCEAFIKDATDVLVGPMIAFVQKCQALDAGQQLRAQSWATPEEIALVVKEAQRRIKAHLAPLQRSMQLYLANKETEFILFRPIRNNVVGNFAQMSQLTEPYSAEDRLIIACPTPDQVSVFLSASSLVSHAATVQPYGKKTNITIIPSQEPKETSSTGGTNI